MSLWITQHFLNSALFWPGVALLALPVIIHLINRLRYRRVRFAAMEFLLASQKRNRRRVLIEQLLLLLLRVAVMALVAALVARLILDPDQLSLFQGTRAHHVLVLDDSASMRDRQGEQSAFDAAREVVRRLVAEGARRPGAQLLSLVLMSAPDQPISGLSARRVDEELLTEVTDRLEALECTHQSVDAAAALEAVQQRLLGERASVRHVHILSDFRKLDWIDNKQAAALVKELAAADVKVNLVRCAAESHENLGVADLGGAVEVAAAGVPVTLSATVRNWGSREARDVSGSVFVDGQRLPRSLEFQTVPAHGESSRRFDVVFPTAQPHAVKILLEGDPFEEDNSRVLAVEVPAENPVLLVDGSPGLEQARYLADALAADKSVTGFAPDLRSPEEMRRANLRDYPLVYLVNVPELAPDAVAALEDYVRGGGGLVWYLGDAVRPAFYNEKLFRPEGGLFPIALGTAPERLVVPPTGGQIDAGKHPLFSILTSREAPILDQIIVNLVYPRARVENDTPTLVRDAQIAAQVQGLPFMLEHRFGEGRVFTCLSSAGPLANPDGVVWNNWANGPVGFSFVVFQLELAKSLIRKDRSPPPQDTGAPLELQFDLAKFHPDVEIISPDERVTRMRVEPVPEASGQSATLAQAAFRDTDLPGVYSVVLTSDSQPPSRQLTAVNMPPQEGALEVIDEPQLRRELGESGSVTIQSAGSFDWIRNESPGSEVRQLLLVLLALVCIGEQVLASRLSYQGE